MPDWEIVRLAREHDRKSFDCGNSTLNDWIQKQASQWEKKNLARTYVAVLKGDQAVLGYYAISNHTVTFGNLSQEESKGLPRLDVPVVLLGRLAVDSKAQGEGLGEYLLIDALRRAQHISESIGVRAVEVDAIDDSAKSFYSKYGFVSLKDDKHHLYLTMNVIRKLDLPPF